jgi:hypothetical protein
MLSYGSFGRSDTRYSGRGGVTFGSSAREQRAHTVLQFRAHRVIAKGTLSDLLSHVSAQVGMSREELVRRLR